ncbi:MAG: flavodoxin family protein [Rhodocyclaceae bacterium]|nr:MAG: flavodoxin family protein [Rhodocyclaceae bacterium]
MTKVVIAYHSGYGHTLTQAQAVLEGAKSVPGVEARLVSVAEITDADWADLDAADAIVFGAPTYMGSVSAPFKTFMDASSKPWFTQNWKDKVAAGFTTSASQSGDKLGSLIQLMVFANQHGMIWTSLGLMPGNNSSTGSVDDLNRLGSFSGAMAQANADQGGDAMRDSDLKTAAHLGQRVATLAAKLRD